MVIDIYFTILDLVGNAAALLLYGLPTYQCIIFKQWSKYSVWYSLYAYQCNSRYEKINTTVHRPICGI